MYKQHQPKMANGKSYRGDCMIRSIVTATGVCYEDVHRIMYKLGWRASRRSAGDWREIVAKTLNKLGYTIEKIAITDPRHNAWSISQEFKEGTYIARMVGHVACIKDGILYDAWDCSRYRVYFIWKVISIE
jgi:hypothetical protein